MPLLPRTNRVFVRVTPDGARWIENDNECGATIGGHHVSGEALCRMAFGPDWETGALFEMRIDTLPRALAFPQIFQVGYPALFMNDDGTPGTRFAGSTEL